ncbi:MAG: VOC family protein [Kofleriaceae bacterium]|nr:VOC family protein [Kofleriaceae bacterium]
MAEIKSYLAGTPSWCHVSVPDLEAAKLFYGNLFGWTFENYGPELGDYHNCLLRGVPVAGLTPSMPAKDSTHPPAAWTVFFDTKDTAAGCAAITASGGTLLSPAMDVAALGRMAIAADPTGAVFGLWQANQHIGAKLINEPGAMTWHEMLSRDVATAVTFYQTVLGNPVGKMPMPGMDYYTIKAGDQMCAGIMAMPSHMPAAVPSYWSVYFAVADADAACATIKSLGGKVMGEPFDTPFGRAGFAYDPWGANFSFIQLRS